MTQGHDHSSLQCMHLAPQPPKNQVMLLLQLPEQAFNDLIGLSIPISSLMSCLHSFHSSGLLVC